MGRGGILGISVSGELADAVVCSCDLEGRGGTCGTAVDMFPVGGATIDLVSAVAGEKPGGSLG
jgi:hypothetical protein